MKSHFALPSFGQDWITGCEGLYIIISLKYSDQNVTMFWRRNGYGYSDSLAGAGKFTEDQIQQILNNGITVETALPIPCTRDAFTTLGMYPVLVDYTQLPKFIPKELSI